MIAAETKKGRLLKPPHMPDQLRPAMYNNTDYTLNESEMQVLSLLAQYSKENPLTKNEMLDRGFSYRNTRRIMTDLRNKGVRVISLGKGFFIAKDSRDYTIYRATQIKRINSLQKQIKAMDSIAEGQVGI